ncbi:MAG: YIP1 family protein [Vicinamibacterales bacterium]
MRHIAGVLWRPRSTMAALVATPTYLAAWLVLLVIGLSLAAALLRTNIGRQALVDERVRVIEALGGRVDDERYARLQNSPPYGAYVTSGGRLLLTPPVTLLVAAGLMALARTDGARLPWAAAMAVSVHASAALVVQQLVATPLHFLRESITSPTNLAVFLPMLEEGTVAARVFGSIDLFGLWWMWLLALGVAAATGRPARRYLGRLLGVYVLVAVMVAAGMAVIGGS